MRATPCLASMLRGCLERQIEGSVPCHVEHHDERQDAQASRVLDHLEREGPVFPHLPERCSHRGGPEDMPAQDAEEPATRDNFQHKILPARQAIDKCLPA